jgi:hypothetical protein
VVRRPLHKVSGLYVRCIVVEFVEADAGCVMDRCVPRHVNVVLPNVMRKWGSEHATDYDTIRGSLFDRLRQCGRIRIDSTVLDTTPL